MQGLTAEKVHWAHRFEKECGGGGHPACDDGPGNPFKQRQVFRREVCPFRTNGEGVPETGSKILCATG